MTTKPESAGATIRSEDIRVPREEPVEGDELKLLPSDRLIDAAYKTLRRHFYRMKWNEAGTRLGTDPEYLHRMRVATRRMRTAARVFREGLPERGLQESAQDLNWVGSVLGRVRDLDVHLMNLKAVSGKLSGDYAPAMAAYTEEVRAMRKDARTAMLRAFDTKRYAAFLERFESRLADGPTETPDAPKAQVPAASAGREIMLRELKRVLEKGRALGSAASDAELHRLRIRCKRLRYACEFFADIYGPTAGKFARRVVKLQDTLGAHHDAVLARETLAQFAEGIKGDAESAGSMFLAVGKLTAVNARGAAAARRKFMEEWERFDHGAVRAPLESRLKKVADRVRAVKSGHRQA